MKTLEIKASARKELGKKATKATRRDGLIPCTINGGEAVHFAVEPMAVKPLIYTPASYIVNVDIDGTVETCVMREVQFHPVREQVLHIDFYRVQKGQPVAIDIPVSLTGNSEGVKAGGKLVLSKRKITVKGQVSDLPDELTVDITELGIGKSIFVGDLQFDKLQLLTPATTAVCAVRTTRAARAASSEAAKQQ